MIDPREYVLSKFPDKAPNSAGEIHTRCPFHDDRHPSFSINVDTGMFVCGSQRCGARGNFPLFYKLSEGIATWAEVFKQLKITRVAKDIEDLFATKAKPQKQYFISPFPAPPDALVEPLGSVRYLVERGLGQSIIDAYGLVYGRLGFSAGISVADSIVAPVWDLDGTYLTFQVRYLNPDNPLRWRTPSGSPIQKLLYGGWRVPWNESGKLWIVEGASDVWNLFHHGIQAVGLFTKEASDSQLLRLQQLCVTFGLTPVVCLDGDTVTPKRDYGAIIQHELLAFGLDAKLIHLEKHEDPGSLSATRVAELRGAE